jgi:hypothetical protein
VLPVALVLALAVSLQGANPSTSAVDAAMAKLAAKYKQQDKKYDALADAIEKEIAKSLNATVWLTAEEAGTARTLGEHPYFARGSELARAAQANAAGGDAKAVARRKALLAKFPWIPRVELDVGLDGGTDRPVPKNDKGFIDLGASPDPFPGFPELSTNQYLYGLQEIVGWRAGVKAGKKAGFDGRDPKKPPAMEIALPGYERVRVLLMGTMPDIALLALPELSHAIHTRLAERRRGTSNDPAPMDEELALLDSKWDGFVFDVPWSKDRMTVVQPILPLMTDRKGFFYRFKDSAHIAEVGDLPFISIQTYPQFAQAFLGQKLGRGDFIKTSAGGKAANDAFLVHTGYLVRYRTLVDQIARAVLFPSLRYPEYLAYLDYPKDKMPGERKADPDFDVARKHAVLLWAWAGGDPAKVADWLQDHLLEKDENRFPQNVGLSAVLTSVVRKEEPEMLRAIAARIADDRKAAGAKGPGEFEREFSPYPTYLDVQGEPSSDLLLASFHAFHERAAKVVREVAAAAVEKEVGK